MSKKTRPGDQIKIVKEPLITGSITFITGTDVFTTEKKTSALSFDMGAYPLHPDNLCMLVIDKPVENTAGDLTVIPYNQDKIDETNERDVPLTIHTVPKITGAGTYLPFIIEGLFNGEGTIKIGMKWASTDGGADKTVYFKVYRI